MDKLLVVLAFGIVLSGCETCSRHPTLCKSLALGAVGSIALSCSGNHRNRTTTFPLTTVSLPITPQCSQSPELCK